MLLGGTVERRPPFDESPVALDDPRDADGRDVVAHGKRRRIAERVGVGALEVGMREQGLADDPGLRGHAPNGADLVSGPACFEGGFAFDAGPGVMIEGPNDGPDFIGRAIQYGAVIGSRHARSMRVAGGTVAPFPDIGTGYLIPGMNPFIPRIMRWRFPPFIIFIIFCICSNWLSRRLTS